MKNTKSERRSILVVDDSPHDRAEAKSALLKGSSQRYAFLEASFGEEALRICQQTPSLDCIVLDIGLPDTDAMDVLARLPRDADDCLTIPVVILTGSASALINQAVLRAGAQDYVGKSWLGPESLTRAVENAIERHTMLRDMRRDRSRQQLVAELTQAAASGYGDALCALLEQVRVQVQADIFLHYAGDGIDAAPLRLQHSTGIDLLAQDRLSCLPFDQIELQLRAIGARACVACRLTVDDLVVATLHFASYAREQFDVAELDFIALVSRQISSAWQRLQVLRSKEAELRSLTDNSPDILTRHDLQMRCVFINSAVTRVTGTSPRSYLGKTGRERGLPDAMCTIWEQAIQYVIDSGRPYRFEFDLVSLTGPRTFECCMVPENLPGGPVQYILGVSHDITERRWQAAQREVLLEKEQAARVEGERVGLIKDEFLATLTHELRTPLSSIVSWSRLLKSSLDNPVLVRRCIEVILDSATAQSLLIDDLLDMNRITSGTMRMESEMVDIDALAASVTDTLAPTAHAKGITLELSLACSQATCVLGDVDRLRQVFWNLLTNAVKFTPYGGTVTLATSEAGGYVSVSVHDTGSGIDAHFLPYLFDRFTQADGSRARVHGGLGLGLSIVKNLVELHGGTITGSSAGIDRGACFTMQFPVAQR